MTHSKQAIRNAYRLHAEIEAEHVIVSLAERGYEFAICDEAESEMHFAPRMRLQFAELVKRHSDHGFAMD